MQPAVEHFKQASAFLDVAVTGALVFVVLAGEFVEKPELAEHRANAAHLEHQPLDRFVARCRLLGQQLSALVGQVDQDRPGFEQCQRLVVRTVGVEDRRDLVVGIEGKKFRGHLIVGVEAYPVRFIRQADLFEHDRYLDAVGGRQGVQLNPLRVLGRPFAGDGECGQIGHGRDPRRH
ncbi:hypothetical protein D3C87_1487730 [compost metagenome]